MGQDWRPNMAFTIGLYLALVKEVDKKIEFAETPESRHKWRVFSIYIIVTYVMSLRGRKGLFLDLKGWINFFRMFLNFCSF